MILYGGERGADKMKGRKTIPMCPKCRSKDTRARLKAKELWCRRCGYVGKREEFFEKYFMGGKN